MPGPSTPITPTIVSDWIYLASQSPRRSQLLNQLGIRHELLLPAQDEDAESLEAALPHETPIAYVKRVTQLKLEAALKRLEQRRLPVAPILCSDTTVAYGRHIYGKPTDAMDAERMLSELAGKTHRVLTAIAIGNGLRREQTLCCSQVKFSELSATQIKNYVASGEPLGKAGSYAVQGRAATFIERISGSYSGIMGLPLFETAQLLRSFGFMV